MAKSISLAMLQFPPGFVNPPHTHPRTSELLFLVKGVLKVGFIDTKKLRMLKDATTRMFFKDAATRMLKIYG